MPAAMRANILVTSSAQVVSSAHGPHGQEFVVSSGRWPTVTGLVDGDFIICW